MSPDPQVGVDERKVVSKTEVLYFVPEVIEEELEEARQNTHKLWTELIQRRKVHVCVCAC